MASKTVNFLGNKTCLTICSINVIGLVYKLLFIPVKAPNQPISTPLLLMYLVSLSMQIPELTPVVSAKTGAGWPIPLS